MGVDLFFILSGFLITGILLSKKQEPLSSFFGHFYERRARRILPPYAALLALVTLLFGAGSWIHHWYLYLFLMNLILALHLHQPGVLVVLWSLAVEEQFYLVWPFLVRGLSEKSIARVAVFIVTLVPVLRWFCTPLFRLEWPIYSMTPFRMDCLAAGALLAVIARRRPNWLPKYGHLGLLLPPVCFGGLLWLGKHGYTTYGNSQVGNTFIYMCTLWACFGVMTWALSGRFTGILKWRPFVYIGRISYTIYLTHLLAIWACSRYFHNRFIVAAAGAVLVICFASISWFVMEKPLLEEKQTKSLRRVPVSS